MNTDVFCNLVTGKLGRTIIGQSRPIFYLGESSVVNFYFEDLPATGTGGQAPDGYSATVENLDVSAKTLSVKIGTRGGASIVTASTWTNLTTTVAITQAFGANKLVWTFTPTPIKGFYSITIAGTITLPVNDDKVFDASVYQSKYEALEQYSHSVFRATTTGQLPANSSESDIEEHVLSLFNEIISGVVGAFVTAHNQPVAFNTTQWGGSFDGFTLKAGLVKPTIRAANVSNNEWNLFCYVPQIELQKLLVHVSNDPDLADAYGQTGWTGNHDIAIASAPGTIAITNLQVNNVSLLGPSGKTGTLTFTDAQFTTLIGTANEKEFFMEVLLDSKTVAEGNILVKKRMT